MTKRINECRFCGHHILAHLHWVNDPEFKWLEGKCSQHNNICTCTEYGAPDNLEFLEDKYNRKQNGKHPRSSL